MSYEKNLQEIEVSHWDSGDYVLVYRNVVLGQTLTSKIEAENMRKWLASALTDLKRAILK